MTDTTDEKLLGLFSGPKSGAYKDDGSKYSDYIIDPSRYTAEEISTMVGVCEDRFGAHFTDGFPFGNLKEKKAILIFGKTIRSDEYRHALAGFPTQKQAIVVRLGIDGLEPSEIAKKGGFTETFVKTTLRLSRRLGVAGAKDEWAATQDLLERAAKARKVLREKRLKRSEAQGRRLEFLKNLPDGLGESFLGDKHSKRKHGKPSIEAPLSVEARKKIEEADDTRKRLEIAREVIATEKPVEQPYVITSRSNGNFDVKLNDISAMKMVEVLKVVG